MSAALLVADIRRFAQKAATDILSGLAMSLAWELENASTPKHLQTSSKDAYSTSLVEQNWRIKLIGNLNRREKSKAAH